MTPDPERLLPCISTVATARTEILVQVEIDESIITVKT